MLSLILSSDFNCKLLQRYWFQKHTILSVYSSIVKGLPQSPLVNRKISLFGWKSCFISILRQSPGRHLLSPEIQNKEVEILLRYRVGDTMLITLSLRIGNAKTNAQYICLYHDRLWGFLLGRWQRDGRTVLQHIWLYWKQFESGNSDVYCNNDNKIVSILPRCFIDKLWSRI